MKYLGFGLLTVIVVGLFWSVARLLSRMPRNKGDLHGNGRV